MASIHCEKRSGKTYRRVQFYDKDGKRRSIRLGTINQRSADTICRKVGRLVSASIAGTPPDPEASLWLTTIGNDLADKLAVAGLAPKRQSAKLAEFIDGYIESRTDLKPNTIKNFVAVRKSLVSCLGATCDLRDIALSDADRWYQSLLDVGFATATISKLVKRGKQLFKVAQRHELVASNPFHHLKAGSERNEDRLQFVDRTTIDTVIGAAPDAEWRLIIALARYGGLRTPSETLLLAWSDIDWERNRITVPSPKTEHHGKAYRVMPLFPELRPYLDEAFALAGESAQHVITRYRGSNSNLRTQLMRIIRRAGVEQWPRLFQNLRASRETELANEFPLHVVTDWIGNSPTIANRHYLQTLDEHFDKAVGGATVGATVVQQSVLQTAVATCTEPHKKQETPADTGVMLKDAGHCDSVQNQLVPPQGLEP